MARSRCWSVLSVGRSDDVILNGVGAATAGFAWRNRGAWAGIVAGPDMVGGGGGSIAFIPISCAPMEGCQPGGGGGGSIVFIPRAPEAIGGCQPGGGMVSAWAGIGTGTLPPPTKPPFEGVQSSGGAASAGDDGVGEIAVPCAGAALPVQGNVKGGPIA
jgi:hypothetical protein